MPDRAARRGLLRLAAAGLALPGAARATAARAPLLVVGPWEIGGLAPARSGFVFQRLQVAQTLVEPADDGSPAPGLAARWSVSADGRTWRFVLREGLRFHDGAPLDAAAVARSLREALAPPGMLSVAPVASVAAARDGAVEIVLRERFAGLAALLSHYSTLILAPSAWADDGSVRAVVGTGPYRITALGAPQQVDVERWDGWPGGPPPRVERVRYLVAGRAETRAMMVESGQADLGYALDPAGVARLRGRRGLSVASVMLPRTAIVKLNAALPALRDARVRRALSLAVDRPGIARALLRDPELAATQLFPPSLAGWHDASLAPLARDPAAAARLLDEAGWPLVDGLRRDASGRPLELQLRTFPDRPELPVIATALQAQWRELGLSVRIAIGNSGDIPLAHRDGSLQLGLAARNYAASTDPLGALRQDFGPRGGDWGAMGWSDEGLLAALDALSRDGPGAPGSAAARARIARVLHESLPVIPIAWYRQQVAVGARVAGVRLDPFERSYRLTELEWRS